MQAGYEEVLTKKSVTVNGVKLTRVRRILKVKTDSEAIRCLIEKELHLQGAFKAHQQLRHAGGIAPILWR